MLPKSVAMPAFALAGRSLCFMVLLRLRGMPGLAPTWLARARQRRDLAALDDRLLRDIGLSRPDIFREVSKPFWAP